MMVFVTMKPCGCVTQILPKGTAADRPELLAAMRQAASERGCDVVELSDGDAARRAARTCAHQQRKPE